MKCRVCNASWLWASVILAAPFPGSALQSILQGTRLPFCRLILPQVALCIRGRLLEALQLSAAKQRHHQLARRAPLLSPLLTHLSNIGGIALSCQIWPPANAAEWNQRQATMPPRWTINLERFQSDSNNTEKLPLSLYGHESEYVPASCPLCTLCSQIQKWKLCHMSGGLVLPLTAPAALSGHYWSLHTITKQNK